MTYGIKSRPLTQQCVPATTRLRTMQRVELEAGLIGLVVGAVASGSVQSYLARADRRRDARSGARLLYMQLHNAKSAIRDLRQRRDWEQMITDWDAYGTSWDRHSEKLAHTLNTTYFHVVSSAFGCLASLARSKATSTSTFEPSDKVLAVYEANVEAAKRITLSASFRWWEIPARRKALAS